MSKTAGFYLLQIGKKSVSRCFLSKHRLAITTSTRRYSTVQITPNRNNASENPTVLNQRARLELAVAYRALDRYKLNEGISNHLSLMAPAARGDGEVMLVIPYGKHWSQVTSSCLLGVKDTGEVVEGEGRVETTASSIHLGLHRNNPHSKAVFHTHSPYITSLGILKDPELLMCHQVSTKFYNRVAYDRNYQGYANKVDEGRRLAGILGSKDVLMMCNHGVITTGKNVAMAFVLLYYLERACMYQMLAMSTGRELSLVSDDMVKANCDMLTHEEEQKNVNLHFNSIMEFILKETPDVAD